MNKARLHELLVYALNRPLAFAVLEIAGRLGAVVRVPGVGHVVSDAEIGRRVLTDTDHFDSHSPGSLGVLVTQVLGPFALLNMDGADHRELKRKLMEVFSPQYIRALLNAATERIVAELHANLRAGRTVDFVAFMRDFASAMACEMIGLAVEREREREVYAEMFVLATAFTAFAGLGKQQLAGRELARAKEVIERLSNYIRDGYARDDAREHSLTRQMRSLGFTFEEVRGVIIIVLVGATELITYGMPRVLALLLDSGQMAKLRARPELIEQAVDEGLRLVTPSNVVLRAVARDCEIDGHRFRRGERALVVFHNIMRQRDRVANASDFDLEREVDPRYRRLLFGAGAHACLGAGLAIAEARVVIGALLSLERELEIVRRRYNHGKTYPGYSSLQVRLRATAPNE
ncbi:MAG TPA: cytochrome P450 [Candidatus Acidoferrum sp.]|jgi:cytochrome P450|nr:cytochrome P450 [Candidatus Acidoferrum sp.]